MFRIFSKFSNTIFSENLLVLLGKFLIFFKIWNQISEYQQITDFEISEYQNIKISKFLIWWFDLNFLIWYWNLKLWFNDRHENFKRKLTSEINYAIHLILNSMDIQKPWIQPNNQQKRRNKLAISWELMTQLCWLPKPYIFHHFSRKEARK